MLSDLTGPFHPSLAPRLASWTTDGFATFFDRDEPPVPELELSMLEFMNRVTDDPGWPAGVFHHTTVLGWKKDAMKRYRPHWGEKAFRRCIWELQYKARQFEDTGMVTVYNPGSCLSLGSCIAKSDTVVPAELRTRLQQAVKVLEDGPDNARDWHLNLEGRVVDLVDPSLFPLVFGKSRVLTTCELGLEDCIEAIGRGQTIKCLEHPNDNGEHVYQVHAGDGDMVHAYSLKHQWLPCEVQRTGEDGPVKITSYINNLHPRHTELYGLVEELIAKSIPLWERVLYETHENLQDCRVVARMAELKEFCHPGDGHLCSYEYDSDGNKYDKEDYTGFSWGEFVSHVDWYCTGGGRPTGIWPEPSRFSPPQEPSSKLLPFNSYPNLQVIVKLSNIHRDSTRPSYPYGHEVMDGLLNESIIATAYYCYDIQNVTPSRLDFYHTFDDTDYLEGYADAAAVFGGRLCDPHLQRYGSVEMPEGRLLAFPNVLLHYAHPSELIDHSKPGHRKVVTLHLVDPTKPILSTANVPPQRKDWWFEHLVRTRTFEKLPQELLDMIIEETAQWKDFPLNAEEAKEARQELVEERDRIGFDIACALPCKGIF